MRFFKILNGATILTAEAHETPAWVKLQTKNNIKIRCPERDAQGIISLDGQEIYQLPDKNALAGVEKTAVEIVMTEYEEIINNYDPEDDTPVIPDDPEPETPMTRAELTAKVAELEAMNAMLTECVLEMSEVVYA